MDDIKYAAGGGGTAGIIHLGALKATIEKSMNITSIVGVSAGSIFGALYYYYQYINNGDIEKTYIDMYNEFMKLNFKDFQDANWFYRSIFIMSKNPAKIGLYKGNTLYEWIKEKTDNISFSDIPYKSLYITATEMYSGSLAVFSTETTPKLTLAEAVRASSSIQGYFRPAAIKVDKIETSLFYKNTCSLSHLIPYCDIIPLINKHNELLFWDGGNLGNCRNDIAVKIGDYNIPVIGVSLTEDSILKISKFNIFGVLSKTIDIMMSAMEHVVISLSKAHSNRPDYLIKPDRFGIGATEFNINDEIKLKLIESGYLETKKLIEEKF